MGFPTVVAILANRLAPSLVDRYLASAGYSGQLTKQHADPDAPNNLYQTVDGRQEAHGRFDDRSRTGSWEVFSSRHRTLVVALAAGVASLAVMQRKAGAGRR